MARTTGAAWAAGVAAGPSHPPAEWAELCASLDGLRRRAQTKLLLRWYWRISFGFSAVAFLILFLRPAEIDSRDRLSLFLGLALIQACISGIIRLWTNLPAQRLARLVDERENLSDRIATAVEYADGLSGIDALLQVDAAQSMRSVRPATVVGLKADVTLSLVALALTIIISLVDAPQAIRYAVVSSSGSDTSGSQSGEPARPLVNPASVPHKRLQSHASPSESEPGRQSQPPAQSHPPGGGAQKGSKGQPSSSQQPSSSSENGASSGQDSTAGQQTGSTGTQSRGAGTHESGQSSTALDRPGSGGQGAGNSQSSKPGQGGTHGSGSKPGSSTSNSTGDKSGQSAGGQSAGQQSQGPSGGSSKQGGSGQGTDSGDNNNRSVGGPGAGNSGPESRKAPTLTKGLLPTIPSQHSFAYHLPKPSAGTSPNLVLTHGQTPKPSKPAANASTAAASPGGTTYTGGSAQVQAVEQNRRIPVGYRRLVQQYFGGSGPK
jgi:hypothetical protein